MSLKSVIDKQTGTGETIGMMKGLSDSFSGAPKIKQTFDSAVLKSMAEELVKVNATLGENAISMEEVMDEMRKMYGTSDPEETNRILLEVQTELKANLESIRASLGVSPASLGVGEQKANEAGLEQQKVESKQTEYLKTIAENTAPGEGEFKRVEPLKKDEATLPIGGIATVLAVAFGSLVGIVSAWVKLFKNTTTLLVKGVTGLGKGLLRMTEWSSQFFPKMQKALFNIEVWVVAIDEWIMSATKSIKSVIKGFTGKIAGTFDDAAKGLKSLFSISKDSKIVKVFSSITNAVKGFVDPLMDAFKVIKDGSVPVMKGVNKIASGFDLVKGFIGKFSEFFSAVGSKMSTFGKIFGAVSKIVSKIAYPLMVIMAVWDTVKGAIEGFEKGGIIGGIVGAIKGLVNNVITSVLDMIKDIASWVAEKLGFGEFSKFLDSFSFTDMFNSVMDKIPEVFENIGKFFTNMADSVLGFFQSIEIPKFKIGVDPISKEFGPWKPFASESASKDTKKSAAASVVPPNPTDAKDVYNKSAEQKQADKASSKSSTTTTVVNAPSTVSTQTQNLLSRATPRNVESSMSGFIRSKFA